MSDEKTLLVTLTGEPYQPARLYYQVRQKNAVIGRFKRLRCIEFDATQDRWVWLYAHEAKSVKFRRSYQDIPKTYRPIVIASITFRENDEMLIDVRSFERVIQTILFFDQKINRRLAKVSTVRIVNKLFPVTLDLEATRNHPTLFFEMCDVVNHKNSIADLRQIVGPHDSPESRLEAAYFYIEKEMKKSLPEVEELDVHFYEDGIESLETSLKMRHIEAFEHWKGNEEFSQLDIMKKIIQGNN